jgi:integrase
VREGVWRSRVVTGYHEGRPVQHAETYGGRAGKVTKRVAQQRHAAHVTAVGVGEVSTSARTLGRYLTLWLDDRSPTWKQTTARRNASIVRQLPESLTSIRLRDLTRGDVQRYLDRLGTSPAAVRRVHAVLTGALSDAVRNGDQGLASNPAAGVRLPRTVVPEATPPTDEDLQRVIGQAGLRDQLWSDLFSFAAFTGLRRGELCGLRWADVTDLDSVTVRHSLETGTKATGGTWSLSDTKSHAHRTVPLAQRARRALARRRAAQGDRPGESAFCFSESVDGSEPIHPDHLSRVFTRTAKDAGCPSVRLKDLRSYAATVLASSAGLKVAQQFLGHRDVTTTARHYAGSRADAVAAGIAALDAIADDPAAELSPT